MEIYLQKGNIMTKLEIFLACFSVIVSIMFLAMNAIHNYVNSFKDFVGYIREIQEDTLHARQLIKDARQIAKEANELIYAVKINCKDNVEEIECEDTLIDFSEDTIVAFRPRDRDDELKGITSEEYIYLRDGIGG
jgi:hypothetical protein